MYTRKGNFWGGEAMKHLILIFIVLSAIPIAAVDVPASSEDFQLIIEPAWQNLHSDPQNSKLFGGKWILVGSITFKKKAKEAVNLNKIELHWNGEPIEDLLGSLYRKNPDKDFLPIEEFLICDGTWNKAQQTMKLDFDQKQTLGILNIFYLVLTVPETLETVVKKGNFEIVQQTLPEPFRVATLGNKLLLSMDVVDSTISH